MFRVEGPGNGEEPGNERLIIDSADNVSIKGNTMLFLNFGQEDRAQSYLARRLADPRYTNSALKTFTVPTSYVDMLRSTAVPEALKSEFPGSPLAVDRRTPDQFGLWSSQFPELLRNIIPGSGEVCP